jgi:hypothetical protein
MSQSAGSGLSSIASVTGLKFGTVALFGVRFTIGCAEAGAATAASSVVASNQMFKELLDIDSSRFWIYAAARETSAAGFLTC